MSNPDPILDGRRGQSRGLMPAKDLVPLTKGSGPFAECRAILIGTAGTANVVMASGKTRNNVSLQVGVMPLRISVLLSGGTADDFWAIF